ncbi:MAG: IS66 family insertion sequence element accessory protein TnpB [Prevotella sp.]|nr:IS66 family insertion sequence element accessory protein TnpB [Prevotella sp.]
MRYYLCPGATDIRRGIYSLSGVVLDVRSGNVYIFINRDRRIIKLLHAEDGGLVLYMKHLEEGHYRLPQYDPATKAYFMEWRDLVLLVEGIREDPGARLKRLKMSRTP